MNTIAMDNRAYNGYGYYSRSEMRIRANRKWRMQIVRRQRIALAVSIAVVLSIVIFFAASIMIKAQNNGIEPMVKYYTVAMVHGGDTLESLAKESFSSDHYDSFDAYINEILRINHLDDPEDLKAGENVVIPYYDIYR
ncbi:MAG: LysM peptidoglycan-binding domain-containing protein [Butyrivibrio sp.]|nr:LysM peptidoglycan-binding domain-containing protein [Butyrivibrio sp.]